MELDANWVVGFVDGEGCFFVGIQLHPEMTTKYQVLPEFTVVQHERDEQILYALKRFFGCGVVRVNHGERKCFRVRKLEHLEQICDFFLKHDLKTKKRIDFIKFRTVVLKMRRGDHLTVEGLKGIIDTAAAMNTANREALMQIKAALG